MQPFTNITLDTCAGQAIFGAPLFKLANDESSTSAGSSERGSSPSESASPSNFNQDPFCEFQPQPNSPVHRKFHQKVSLALHPGLGAPPGLAPPPGLAHAHIAPPPGLGGMWEALESLKSAQQFGPPPGLTVKQYTPKIFRKELTAICKELASSRNVAAAVRSVRQQNVPASRQAAEFTDLLTRAAEEHRGIARRLMFAFAAGLASGSGSAFNHSECLAGLRCFFTEVFDELCEEVPRLPVMVQAELLPVLRSVLPDNLLNDAVPGQFQVVVDPKN